MTSTSKNGRIFEKKHDSGGYNMKKMLYIKFNAVYFLIDNIFFHLKIKLKKFVVPR